MSQITESVVKGAPKPMTPFQEFWHYFKRNKGAVVGLVYIVIMLVVAVGAGSWLHMRLPNSSVMPCLGRRSGRRVAAGSLFWVPTMSAVMCCRV
ncbi:Dipeptide transport system permease protein dppC [Serratia fonticola]|uniref:Dipeptide transport system permease protein dppC n=1 Tax=Serratia fonticola TaxID=47917 RepID=A0A3S4XAA9_SERFO|nr:Dipeptide transport system permease protein dppC [Serratia fonticola]